KVFSHEELLEETFNYAAQVASNPYLSVRYAKDLVRMYWNHNRTDEGWEREFAAIQEITRTGDCREGIRAFLEKREANYKGPYYDNPPWGREKK
ncbi:MAG: enoyl-CoA hydratase-related protein, partial [Pseudomonadota bacterium]|nr:enoyl-CoA hydratase-related protein [Pseudomonadota bacterium]